MVTTRFVLLHLNFKKWTCIALKVLDLQPTTEQTVLLVGCKTQNQLKQYIRLPRQYEYVNARMTIVLSHSKLKVFWEGYEPNFENSSAL